jgi:RNA polymerase sigma factor (sigma-70 family)
VPDQHDLGDGDLVRLARAGDQVAFRLLVERYQPVARARAAQLCHNRHELDDVVQESFLQAFVGLDRLRDPDRFGAWLGGIVLNICRARRREAPVDLIADWPERLHPQSTEGLPSADRLDRAGALRDAIAGLAAGQRRAVALYYYAGMPAGQIADSPGAAKASLHKARRRLRQYLTTHRPDLVPAAALASAAADTRQDPPMTTVRIAHVVPRPGRLRTSHILVVLADDIGHRALPIWLSIRHGGSLWRLADRRAAGSGARTADREELPPGERTPRELITARLLEAAGAAVTGVDVDELGPGVTAARIGIAGPAGTRIVTTGLADGLALALAADAPVRVADAVLERLAVPAARDESAAGLVPQDRAGHGRQPRRRYEPRNLEFAQGLDYWRLGGSFLQEASGSHWRDYECAAQDGSAILRSAVPDPYEWAILGQDVFADDFRGHVTFRGEVRTRDVARRAGLFLRVVSETPRSPGPDPAAEPAGGSATPIGARLRRFPGTRLEAAASDADWTTYEVTAEVPEDAAVIAFGLFLAGPGRAELRNAALTGPAG